MNILSLNHVTRTLKCRIRQRCAHVFKSFTWKGFATRDFSARNSEFFLVDFSLMFFPGISCLDFVLHYVSMRPWCVCARVNTYIWHIKVWLLMLWRFVFPDCFSHMHSWLYIMLMLLICSSQPKQPGLTFNEVSRPHLIREKSLNTKHQMFYIIIITTLRRIIFYQERLTLSAVR